MVLCLNKAMSDTRAAIILPPVYLFRAMGANRIIHLCASRITEGFARGAAPSVGAICVAVHNEDDEGDVIFALAAVRGIAGVASGLVRATLTPIHSLLSPIPLGSLRDDSVELGDVPGDFAAKKIALADAAALIEYLKAQDPSVTDWLERVFGEHRSFSRQVEQSRVEAKDAVQLAAQLAEIELPADAFVSPPAASEDETLLQTVLNAGYELDLEEELLPLDLQRFDGKLTGKQHAASVTVFSDKWERKRLVVMSVNKKPIELELGVDLLYWDQFHDSFTFIQYKRLEKVTSQGPSGGSEWVYTRRAEIQKQLKLMPTGQGSAAVANEWRAFGTPFWFKFVRGDAGSKLDDKTLKGMHVPADWLRLAMTDETLRSGPKGGFRVTYNNTKYLGRSAFTQLISRGFVGTAGARSKAFKKVLKNSKDRELIIAVRTDWQQDDQAPNTANPADESDGNRNPAGFLGYPL